MNFGIAVGIERLAWLKPGAGLIANCHPKRCSGKGTIKFSGLYLRAANKPSNRNKL